MEKSFAFNSDFIDGKYDREYFIEELLEYFSDLFSHGISPLVENNLQVVSNGDMSVTLKPGVLWDKNGCKYKNTEDLVINLSPADGIRNRIDRISITWKNAEREMLHTVQEGEYAYNPKAPACRRNANYRDYVVADVFVRAGAINISQANISDQRLNSDVCGMAAGLLRQFDLKEFFVQINEYFSEFVQRTDGSYDQFLRDMKKYLDDLKESGDTRLDSIVNTMVNYEQASEEQWREWFDRIRQTLASVENGEMLERVLNLMNDLYDIATPEDITAIINGTYVDDGNNESTIFEPCTPDDITAIIDGTYIDSESTEQEEL